MSREYEPTDSEWMWDKIKSLVADNTRLFDENERLRKENAHMDSMWKRWTEEQRKKVKMDVYRTLDINTYPGTMRFDMTLHVDEQLYRQTNFDYAMELVQEVYKKITQSMQHKFSKQQEVTK